MNLALSDLLLMNGVTFNNTELVYKLLNLLFDLCLIYDGTNLVLFNCISCTSGSIILAGHILFLYGYLPICKNCLHKLIKNNCDEI